MTAEAVTVFFSYSHKDETFRDELANHLRILERQGVISSWHDRKIIPGEEWDGKIDENLQTADIILLLISSDFIASNYCWDVEVKIAMQHHEAGNAVVIPIILRRVDWNGAAFGRLQFLPKNADPVESRSWANRDDAYHNITQGIRVVANQLIQMQTKERNELKKLQDYFKLRDEDIVKVEAEVTASIQENVPSNIISDWERTKISLPQPIQTKEIELNSERGVNYTKLRDLLAAGEWKEADEETWKVMCQTANRVTRGWLRGEDIDNFPCKDLRTINQLWLHYSRGKFGFSVQKEIYQGWGGTKKHNEKVWKKFCDTVRMACE